MATMAPLLKDFQELPVLLKDTVVEELNTIAASTNPSYIFELFPGVATTFRLRGQLTGKRAILSVVYEAACAALTKDPA